MESATPGADPTRLRSIRRHLSAFLPGALLDRFWEEGFAAVRQPSFRLNALRGGSNAGAADGGSTGGGDEGTVRRLLEGFGLPLDTPVERCPYYPLARLLPARAAAAVRVAGHIHAPGPIRSGAVYFMSLSSMLPALALMAHQPPPSPPSPHLLLPRRQPQQQRVGEDTCGMGPAPAALAASNTISSGSGSGRAGRRGASNDLGGGPRVLDLCAAPGGKTALLAELMGNRGTLLAVDASWPRLQRLQFNVERLVPDTHHNHNNRLNGTSTDRGGGGGDRVTAEGADVSDTGLQAATCAGAATETSRSWWRRGCVIAVHADGTELQVDEHGLPRVCWPDRGRGRGGAGGGAQRRRADGREDRAHGDKDEGELGVYDRVLVDAPCSGLGRLQLRRPSSYNRWDERHVARHPERQRQLLLRGARLLRRGGSLVYSTCTIDPRENEAVVAWLLRHMGGRLRLVEPHLPARHPAAGLLQHPAELRPGAGTTAGWPGSAGSGSGGGSGGGSGASTDDGEAAHGLWLGDPPHLAGPHLALPLPRMLLPASSPTLPLREALEAHRPGCTYPAMLDGAWWAEMVTVAGRGSGSSHRRARSDTSDEEGSSAAAVMRLLDGWQGAHWGSDAVVSWDWVRSQVELCCVRVAPGHTYEGFFLAHFVKE